MEALLILGLLAGIGIGYLILRGGGSDRDGPDDQGDSGGGG